MVQVEDTGRGIPAEDLREVFVPRFASQGGRVEACLGLFVAYSVVQKHRGDIRVESEVGKGSTFTVTLPLGLRDEFPDVNTEAEP